MNINRSEHSHKRTEGFFSAIYIGALFILLGLVYLSNLPTNIFQEIVNFFSTLTLSPIPGIGFSLPAPASPQAHTTLYGIAFQFSLGIAIIEVVILALRVIFHSPIARKAETVGNVVFWFGASYLILSYLTTITTANEWFVFWSAILIISGLSLIVRALILIIEKRL